MTSRSYHDECTQQLHLEFLNDIHFRFLNRIIFHIVGPTVYEPTFHGPWYLPAEQGSSLHLFQFLF